MNEIKLIEVKNQQFSINSKSFESALQRIRLSAFNSPNSDAEKVMHILTNSRVAIDVCIKVKIQ